MINALTNEILYTLKGVVGEGQRHGGHAAMMKEVKALIAKIEAEIEKESLLFYCYEITRDGYAKTLDQQQATVVWASQDKQDLLADFYKKLELYGPRVESYWVGSTMATCREHVYDKIRDEQVDVEYGYLRIDDWGPCQSGPKTKLTKFYGLKYKLPARPATCLVFRNDVDLNKTLHGLKEGTDDQLSWTSNELMAKNSKEAREIVYSWNLLDKPTT